MSVLLLTTWLDSVNYSVSHFALDLVEWEYQRMSKNNRRWRALWWRKSGNQMENFNENDFTLQWVGWRHLKRALYQSTIFYGLEKRFTAKEKRDGLSHWSTRTLHCRNFDRLILGVIFFVGRNYLMIHIKLPVYKNSFSAYKWYIWYI